MGDSVTESSLDLSDLLILEHTKRSSYMETVFAGNSDSEYIFGNCSTKELKYKCRKFSNMLCYICGRIKACDFRIWRDERTDAEVGCWRGAGGEEIEKGLVDSGVRVWECKGNTHVRV